MDSPLRVPPDELRGEAEKRKKRVLNAPPLNKPLPKGLYAGIKDWRNAKVMRKRQLVGLPFVSGYPTFLFDKIV